MIRSTQEIFYQCVEGVGSKDSILRAMEEYAKDYRERLTEVVLERDELDEQYKKTIAQRNEWKATALEYKKLYDEYKDRYNYAVIDGTYLRQKLEQLEEQYDRDIPAEEEKIYVTTSSPEDVYAAFTDKYRTEQDAEQAGVEWCAIKLYRGPKV